MTISTEQLIEMGRRPLLVSQLEIEVCFDARKVEVSFRDRSLKAHFPDGMPGTTETINDVIRNVISSRVADMLSNPPCDGGYYNTDREFKDVLVDALYERLVSK